MSKLREKRNASLELDLDFGNGFSSLKRIRKSNKTRYGYLNSPPKKQLNIEPTRNSLEPRQNKTKKEKKNSFLENKKPILLAGGEKSITSFIHTQKKYYLLYPTPINLYHQPVLLSSYLQQKK